MPNFLYKKNNKNKKRPATAFNCHWTTLPVCGDVQGFNCFEYNTFCTYVEFSANA
jgi:hypothetical protein